MIQKSTIFPPFASFLIFLYKWLHIIYYKSILITSYFVIMMILIFVDFNFLNCFVLICFLFILAVHLFKIIPSDKSNFNLIGLQIHKYWSCFLFLVSIIAITRYLYQFLSFNWLKSGRRKCRRIG